MASAAIQIPSHNRVEPGSHQLKVAQVPVVTADSSVDAEEVAANWLKAFQEVLKTKQWGSLSKLFLQESYWRDQLCLSWDFRMQLDYLNRLAYAKTLQIPSKVHRR